MTVVYERKTDDGTLHVCAVFNATRTRYRVRVVKTPPDPRSLQLECFTHDAAVAEVDRAFARELAKRQAATEAQHG